MMPGQCPASIGLLGSAGTAARTGHGHYHFVLLWLPVAIAGSTLPARERPADSVDRLGSYATDRLPSLWHTASFEGRGALTCSHIQAVLMLALFSICVYSFWK